MRLFPVWRSARLRLASLRQQSGTGDAVVMMEVMKGDLVTIRGCGDFSAMRHLRPNSWVAVCR